MYNFTAVIPAYSDKKIVTNSVLSICRQWIPENAFKIELLIINDNTEKKHQYDYFLCNEFKTLTNDNIEIKIIENEKNLGQGQSRQKGIDNAKYNYIILCDEDDIYSPNAFYRFFEILSNETQSNENKKVGLIAAPLYGFDKGNKQIIQSNSIWVNSKVYNKEFLQKHNLRFPIGENSHRAEDYPFVRCVDYALSHDTEYKRIDIADTEPTFYYWYPNPNSRSRQTPFYGSLLAGYTMQSSILIFDYFKNFAEKNGILEQEDEYLKHEILNMCAYSYYNYLYFLYDLSHDWNDCKAEYWNAVKNGLKGLKERLMPYWCEIVPSDIIETLYNIKNHSDLRFIEGWRGSFEEFINNGDKLLNYDFNEIKDYCKTLQFDGAMHEISANYVKAWKKRHEKQII